MDIVTAIESLLMQRLGYAAFMIENGIAADATEKMMIIYPEPFNRANEVVIHEDYWCLALVQ